MSSEDFDDNQEICDDFVAESREMLAEAEPLLVELESSCAESGELDMSQIDTLFRAFHSMKGSGGFLNFDNLVSVTHVAESLLDLFRNGQAELRADHINVLCTAMDFICELLDHIESAYDDAGFEDRATEIVAQLQAAMSPAQRAPAAAAEPAGEVTESARPEMDSEADSGVDALRITPDMIDAFATEAADRLDGAEAALLEIERDANPREPLERAFGELHSLKGNCGFIGFGDMEDLSHQAEDALEALRARRARPDPKTISALLSAIDVLRAAVQALPEGEGRIPDKDRSFGASNDSSLPAAPLSSELAAPQPIPKIEDGEAKPESGSKRAAKASIRVDLDKLDALMDLVGELILAETMVTHNPDLEGHEFERFDKAAVHLNRITRSLQDVAMGARMIPIGGTFRKMLRLVRDLAQKQGKKIDLELVGESTEIDKTVVEAIADPLVHIVRNSVDHGIEEPSVREAVGKEPGGRIRLEARHQGGEIWILIEDDGKGLDRDTILAKAQERGLLDPSRGEVRDPEIFRCIFEPGFSTAAAVTDVSGRGVGMDVVRRNIDALNGRVDVASQLGAGTRITIRLPLTLAIIEGMLVSVGDTIYTFPLLSIRESIPVRREDVTTLSDGHEMVHIRGRLLPMIRLSAYHAIRAGAVDLEDGIVIVVEHEDPFCVWVDAIIGQRQTVIKGLPDYLGRVKGVSGCSILSNGDISLILDLQAMCAETGDG